MVVTFLGKSAMDLEEAQCPMCLGQMEREEREGSDWLACPNGCPTEFEAPIPKPPAIETELHPEVRAAAGGT